MAFLSFLKPVNVGSRVGGPPLPESLRHDASHVSHAHSAVSSLCRTESCAPCPHDAKHSSTHTMVNSCGHLDPGRELVLSSSPPAAARARETSSHIKALELLLALSPPAVGMAAAQSCRLMPPPPRTRRTPFAAWPARSCTLRSSRRPHRWSPAGTFHSTRARPPF